MILAIDQGTTGTTCLVFDEQAEPIGRGLPRVHPALPAAGLGRARRARDLGGHARPSPARRSRMRARAPGELEALGITNQRETVVRVGPGAPASRCTTRSSGRTGAPPRAATSCASRATRRSSERAPGWCSTRTSRRRRSSGCSSTSTACASARASGRALFGTIDSWLIFKLTGEHVTDATNASRTLLYDIARGPLGPRAARAVRRVPSARCPSVLAERGRVRADARRCAARARGAGRRHRRRPAGGAVRPGAASTRAWARTPTAPARSCCSTPASRCPSRRPGC